MILAIPFFPSSSIDYGKFAEAVKKNGQCDGHILLVVSLHSDEEEALDFRKKLEPLFSDSFSNLIPPPDSGGVTGAANNMFKAAAYYFKGHKEKPGEPKGVPMVYMDPTWHPHKTGWLDTIQGEYFSRGMPLALSRWDANNAGEKVTRGPVLLSRTYFEQSALLPHIPPRTHWRVYLRNEIGNVLMDSKTICTGNDGVVRPVKTPPKK